MTKRAAFLFMLALATSAVAQHVRVMLQVIEVPHAELTKWTTADKAGGQELHERAMTLVSSGGAEIVETSVVICRSGERAFVESIAEMIYPTEYEPSSMGGSMVPLDSKLVIPVPLRPTDCVSFETRNAGTTLEIEPTIGGGGKIVDLRLAFESVSRESLVTWTEFRDQWGDASIKRPIFETKRLSSALTLLAGKFELFNIFTPKPAAVPAATTRQLVFVKADVLPHPNE
ncbi:hypothetical protein OKA04_13080 [Luteolibacter flavescens]|uniref:Uncharacterized protein n=1 Tax=Luteolibacter flavescens TaxID=1859460 RepID=A0ABT3FR01_9BACT|nr:hypothetical protein [Luteolibacter flavescens]MCW1885666.1 hypothetical protein [Luteolibacter flavescens]